MSIELTIVPAVDGGQHFFVGFDEVRELVHQDASLGSWQQFPGWMDQCCFGCLHGDVDIFC
jgi:hypothetical protein